MKLTPFVLCVAAMCSCGPNTAFLSSPVDAELEDDTASTSSELVSNSAAVWFPIKEGNTWTLQAPSGESRTVTFGDVIGGVGYLGGLDRWLGTFSSAPNSLYSWSEDTETWEPFIRFGYAVTTWSWGHGACNAYTVKRAAGSGPLTTPAGTFSDVRTIAFERKPSPTARCLPPAFTALTFAPHVGLIAIETYDAKFLLTSAKVNGKPIPSPTGIKGSLRFDKSTYVNQPNTIRCITTPCPSNEVTAIAKATYTVTNAGPNSVTFQFNTGCQFDIALVDSAGKTVRSLSDDRACTQALTNFTLTKGQSKVFSAQLPLANDDGQLLGDFTAKAKLLPRNASPNAAAVTSFTVKAD
jgi:hypothetical protein